jgi:hypothetical protein
LLENPRGFQAIHSRHRQIEEHDIGQVLPCLADGISPIYSLADNFDICLGTEKFANSATHVLIVIDYEHAKNPSIHGISAKAKLGL